MIEARDVILFFGSIISLLLLALSCIVWYWANRVDSRFTHLEEQQKEDRVDIELIKQNCFLKRKTDMG